MARRNVGRRRADPRGNRRRRIDIPTGHGHGHGHGHGDQVVDTSVVDGDAVVARRVRVVVAALLIPLIAAAVIAMVVLWPSGDLKADLPPQAGASGEVVKLEPCAESPDACDLATVKITSGPDGDQGVEAPVEVPKGKQAALPIEVGDKLLLGFQDGAPIEERYSYTDHDRGRPLLILAVVFAVAVVVLSRWRGLAALVALGITAVTLTQFVLPAILRGENPLLVSVVGGAVIMTIALYLTHGINAQSSVALAGTIAALGLTAVLGWMFVKVASLSGVGAEGASQIKAFVPDLDLAGVLAAGIVIGALGVLDDVTVTQASAVWELSAANPAAGRASLFSAGLRIGRAHVASVVNTLVLAYAGAALPLLMIFAVSGVDAKYVITTEMVAIEIVRGLVGSLGIIAAVPLTTALAALAVADRSPNLVAQPDPPPTPDPTPPPGPTQAP
ncbi:putative membrane protein [Kribbella amoyensis]|uniref:Putative membrane protein n=1 Tax=Kribbella amoyensis TaxID=996641 RepID=A0A561BVW4_9ACTN|nr:YibE/F family protein [Kribbella amoyensis]TWD82978.1 putative membrane protein [Kribbella amoyensis]